MEGMQAQNIARPVSTTLQTATGEMTPIFRVKRVMTRSEDVEVLTCCIMTAANLHNRHQTNNRNKRYAMQVNT